MKLLLIALVFAAQVALAVEPEEVLDDPALEERARSISKNLRCMVCRNESIDESHAALAADLRRLVRELLVSGKTDEAVYDAIVARYGEYVLLRPRPDGVNWILYVSGPVMFICALLLGGFYIRRRGRPSRSGEPNRLDDDETSRLSNLLSD